MAPQKLSEADKQDILALYRETAETSTSLASRFGVSTSTIGRILRQGLPAVEYDELVQQKRAAGKAAGTGADDQDTVQEQVHDGGQNAGRKPSPKIRASRSSEEGKDVLSTPGASAKVAVDELDNIAASLEEPETDSEVAQRSEPQTSEEKPADDRLGRRSRRRRSSPQDEEAVSPVLAELEELEKEIQQDLRYGELDPDDDELEEDLEEDVADLEDELDEDEDEDEDDDLDEDFDEEDLDDDEEDLPDGDEDYVPVHLRGDQIIQILPLSEAKLPRTCYLVVDRTAELITRPLSDFADLGQIPEVEAKERTLPVFDNHRIAKRFMRRAQRIVKIPDSQMFLKTRSYLQAKGITRLLVDGQIYTLEGADS